MNGRFVRSVLAAALLCLGCSSLPSLATSLNGTEVVVTREPYTPLGCFQITGLSSAKSLTSLPTDATLISLSVEGQPVRMRDDGTNPTSSVGLYLPVGGPWPYSSGLAAMKFIETAASATIDYCAYK